MRVSEQELAIIKEMAGVMQCTQSEVIIAGISALVTEGESSLLPGVPRAKIARVRELLTAIDTAKV